MAEYGVEVGVGWPSGVERALAIAVEDAAAVFPNQVRAIAELAEAGQRKWMSYAAGKEELPGGGKVRSHSGRYLRSIQLEEDGEHSYTIFSDDPKALDIEEGRDAWSMIDALQTSHKVRRSKKGTLYLIVPFRHGTPDTVVVGEYAGSDMPADVTARMREKAKSRITGQFAEPSVHDPATLVRRNVYDWGGRLTLSELAGMGYDVSDKKTQRMAGMVRMDTSTPNRSSSLYLTFRTVSENSPEGSWLVPERKGKFVAKAVAEWLNAKFPEIMDVALELDAEHLRRLAGV